MTTKFYQRMYLSHEFLPTSADIPLSMFKSITLCREDGTVKIALTLRSENSNPFEKFLKIPCSPEQVKEYLVCLRKQRQVKFREARESRAWSYLTLQSQNSNPLFSVREENKVYVFTNPRPGIDVEEYIEFEKPCSAIYMEDKPKPILHTLVTVWHKGMRKVQSHTGYSESHRTRELSWTEAADLLRKWTTESEQQAKAKQQAEEHQREHKEYRERWQNMEGMRLGEGDNSSVISCRYGGPHIADYCGNYLFPIPKNIMSYVELRSKIEELLDDYYANCE